MARVDKKIIKHKPLPKGLFIMMREHIEKNNMKAFYPVVNLFDTDYK